MENRRNRIEMAYTILSGDDQLDRACKTIPDSFCTSLPSNYVMNLVNGAASKPAEQVASAKVVLPWLLSTMGAPAYLVGFLLPLRQAGSLLPQMIISGQMRRFPVRKWFWVTTVIVQAMMLMLMIAAALTLPPLTAGMLVAVFLLVFSLARGGRFVVLSGRHRQNHPQGKTRAHAGRSQHDRRPADHCSRHRLEDDEKR